MKNKLIKYCGKESTFELVTYTPDETSCVVMSANFKNVKRFKLDFDIQVIEDIKATYSHINQNFCDHVKFFEDDRPDIRNLTLINCSFDKNLKNGPIVDIIKFYQCTLDDFSIMDFMNPNSSVRFQSMKIDDFIKLNKKISNITLDGVKFSSYKLFPRSIHEIKIYQYSEHTPTDILQLFTYEDLKHVNLTSNISGDSTVCDIVTESFNKRDSIYECASRLIEAGFDEYAML